MAPSKFLLGVLMAVGLSSAVPTSSNTIVAQRQEPSMPAVESRGFNGMGPASIIRAVIEYLKPANAYDPSTPDKCVLEFKTTAGGDCMTYVQCKETDSLGSLSNPAVWSQCFVNGRQYFNDPNIGDYSINFTQAGGVNGNTEDGLHHPILQLADVGNWDPIDVQSLSDQALGNNDGGHLCSWTSGDFGGAGSRTLAWKCGIPKLGTNGAFGISSDTIVHTTGFTPGWCTFHIIQHQRNENGIGNDYVFDVNLYDDKKEPIGQVKNKPIDGTSKAFSMTSNLPYTLVITASGNDEADVEFAYAGTTWKSSDSAHCSMGGGPNNGYQDGYREGNCGFTC